MTWIAAIALAAICNAVMDSVEGFRIQQTIFKNKKQKFWNRELSKMKYLPFTNYEPDAWHIHKSLMLIFLCAAVLLYHYYPIWKTDIWFVDLVIMGIAWDVTFNTFYNHLLKRKR